jgi:hypothetical protein
LADKSIPLILEALSQAAADPSGVPLHGNKAKPGLFGGSAAAKKAAQHCKEQNWLRVVRTEKRGQFEVEFCAITEEGLAYLISELSPKQVLEELVRALESRQQQVSALVASVHQTQASLDMLRATADKILRTFGTAPLPGTIRNNGTATLHNGTLTHGHAAAQIAGADHWQSVALACLNQWQAAHPTEDCSLPELYRQTQQSASDLTVGQFHDGLRCLYDQGTIYLHPWTGPLCDLPEPSLVLMVGHEIAYYVSIRK